MNKCITEQQLNQIHQQAYIDQYLAKLFPDGLPYKIAFLVVSENYRLADELGISIEQLDELLEVALDDTVLKV